MATYTQYLVQQAIERYEAEGLDATVARHNDPGSVDGQWYVFVIDADGTRIANPTTPDLIGTNAGDAVDINGKAYGTELVAATENGRWVDYYFVNPGTGEPERKHTWVVRHDGLFFASGWYRIPDETPADEMPAEETPADPGPKSDMATG